MLNGYFLLYDNFYDIISSKLLLGCFKLTIIVNGPWEHLGEVYMFYQSINQHLYGDSSRFLLRGAPDPGQAEKNSLEKVVEMRTSTIWEVP